MRRFGRQNQGSAATVQKPVDADPWPALYQSSR